MPLVVGAKRIVIAVVANKKGRSEFKDFGALVLQLFILGPSEQWLKNEPNENDLPFKCHGCFFCA
ncbi:hypothetical protein A3843_11255 [Pseudovibrio exalbescens]|uniref:Uncharacterized protein n=1 Tax=Pseudovibrio exalbescens TaxID=197461 RepID=A0A1U7JGK5_9HYPH|nr:hypothetical protein A3843_11255 [Pseudovibrio exalbescens]